MNQTVRAAVFPSMHPAWRAPLGTAQSRPFHGRAWLFSGVVHGLLIAFALWGFQQAAEEPTPMVRLVFVEPPPPPPAPLGAPLTKAPAPNPVQPPTVQEQVQPKPQERSERPKKEQVKPKPREPERLKIVKKKAQEKPKPQPEPPPLSVSDPEPVALAKNTSVPPPGIATGATESNPKGVIGGQAGGLTGGVIGSQGAELLSVAQVANPPVLLTRVTPEYPRQARRQGIAGLVVLEAILDREGRVEDNIKVLQSIPLLDEAAVQALRRWRFQPARDDRRQAVRVILEVPIRFVLR